MKFAKGLIVGGLITTGLLMVWADSNNIMDTKKMTKKGKKLAKKMGIL